MHGVLFFIAGDHVHQHQVGVGAQRGFGFICGRRSLGGRGRNLRAAGRSLRRGKERRGNQGNRTTANQFTVHGRGPLFMSFEDTPIPKIVDSLLAVPRLVGPYSLVPASKCFFSLRTCDSNPYQSAAATSVQTTSRNPTTARLPAVPYRSIFKSNHPK